MEDEGVKYSFIIPLHKEDGNIIKIFDQFSKSPSGCELIFVLSRSSGIAAEIIFDMLRKYNRNQLIESVSVCEQRGIGKADAVWTGFIASKGMVVSIFDGDCSIRVDDAFSVANLAIDNDGIAVGDRSKSYLEGDGALGNYLYNRMLASIYNFLYNRQLKDLLCGSKAISRRWIDSILEFGAGNRRFKDRWGDLVILVSAAQLSIPITSVAVNYEKRSWGISKINRVRDSLELLAFLVLNGTPGRRPRD